MNSTIYHTTLVSWYSFKPFICFQYKRTTLNEQGWHSMKQHTVSCKMHHTCVSLHLAKGMPIGIVDGAKKQASQA